MAIMTCLSPFFFLKGDGVSTTFLISLKTTPILLDKFTVVNFPKNVDGVVIVGVRDSLGNDVTSQVTSSFSGSAITLTFTTPFSDLWIVALQFDFGGG